MPQLGRTEKKNRSRVKKTQITPVRIASASVADTVLTLTFNQPVVLKGTPKYTTDVAGAVVVSATSPAIDTVEVTFDQSIATATQVIIEFVDPAVRSKDGGYIADSTFPIT